MLDRNNLKTCHFSCRSFHLNFSFPHEFTPGNSVFFPGLHSLLILHPHGLPSFGKRFQMCVRCTQKVLTQNSLPVLLKDFLRHLLFPWNSVEVLQCFVTAHGRHDSLSRLSNMSHSLLLSFLHFLLALTLYSFPDFFLPVYFSLSLVELILDEVGLTWSHFTDVLPFARKEDWKGMNLQPLGERKELEQVSRSNMMDVDKMNLGVE